MKYVYSLVLVAVFCSGCSKDFLKRYDRRIIGTWSLFDVDRRGVGGDLDRLPFLNGTFIFADEGRLTYTNPAGQIYEGTWDINKLRHIEGQNIRLLTVHVTDFNTGETRYEQYEEMLFTGTNRFRASIFSGAHVYVSRFKRL